MGCQEGGCPVTWRLYWEEPHGASFSARIVRFLRDGGEVGVVLDRTLFHPEGGGQPCDVGSLSMLDSGLASALGRSDLPVVKVLEAGPDIIHFIDAGALQGSGADHLDSLPQPPQGGWPVRGAIDWGRRFDLMQQHTGQHVLSRAFEELLAARTVGFHLAKDYVSIDLDVPALSLEDAAGVEDLANQVVFRDVPVVAREYAGGELPPDVRKRFGVESERIRVVHVGEFDACPCGGTHVTSSGQIGLIKINQIDRAHGGVRVVFRCGRRALADYRDKQGILDETAKLLSQAPQAVPDSVRSLVAKAQELMGRLEETQESLLEFEIQALLRPEKLGAAEAVVAVLPGKSPEQLKRAARRISEESGKLTVCFAREPRFSAVAVAPAARGENAARTAGAGAGGKAGLTTAAPDARSVVAAIAAAWGGRGGGTPQIAQLGSKEPLAADDRAVEDDIRRICREIMRGQGRGTRDAE